LRFKNKNYNALRARNKDEQQQQIMNGGTYCGAPDALKAAAEATGAFISSLQNGLPFRLRRGQTVSGAPDQAHNVTL
jgi:hypothetical protein